MARLVLHVGSHKTGTTYLQTLFHQNRSLLETAGLHYPDIGPNTAHHVLASPWLTVHGIPDSFFDDRGPDGLWDDLIARYTNVSGTVFLSGENFLRCHPETVDMVDLAQRLSAFEDVQVLYVMRAQTEMIQALWLQLAKNGQNVALYNYIRTVIEQRRGFGVWIDHNAVYDSLLKGFAPEQIHFMDYGVARKSAGGIAQQVLDLLDVDIRVEDLTPPPSAETNISPDPLGFWIASEIAGTDLPSAALVDAVTQPLKQTGRPNTLLARYEHVKTTTRYSAANAKLAKRLQKTQPGFTFQEITPPENMIYREEIPNATWLKITQAAIAVPNKIQHKHTSPWMSAKQRLAHLVRRADGQ